MSFRKFLEDADPFEVQHRLFGDADLAYKVIGGPARDHYKPSPGDGQGGGAAGAPETLLTTVMPSLTDSDRRDAARKAKARLLARGGRASTILTDGDALGGGL